MLGKEFKISQFVVSKSSREYEFLHDEKFKSRLKDEMFHSLKKMIINEMSFEEVENEYEVKFNAELVTFNKVDYLVMLLDLLTMENSYKRDLFSYVKHELDRLKNKK